MGKASSSKDVARAARVGRQTGSAPKRQLLFPLGILAIGAALLMIGGEFDLSLGSMIAFAGLFFGACVVTFGWPLIIAIPATLVFAAFFGVINGQIVVRTGDNLELVRETVRVQQVVELGVGHRAETIRIPNDQADHGCGPTPAIC